MIEQTSRERFDAWYAKEVKPRLNGGGTLYRKISETAWQARDAEVAALTRQLEEARAKVVDAELPMQPIIDGRFKANPLVRRLLDDATSRGCGMNELMLVECSNEDRQQFAQLIGYSIDGYGELSYVSDAAYDAAIRQLSAQKTRSGE